MTRKPVAEMEIKLFAFWSYDLFPYELGGEVTAMNEDGLVQTKEFGKGSWFKPTRLVPLAKGKAQMARLKALAGELDYKINDLKRLYLAAAEEIKKL